MAQSGPNMTQNGPRMTQNDPKWPKNDPKWPKITPNGPNMTPGFTHFFRNFLLTEKAITQTFSLLECMILTFDYLLELKKNYDYFIIRGRILS